MYPTDLTDSQWEVMESLLSDQRKRKYSLRSIFNALFYLNKAGCQCGAPPGRMLPKEYPPFRSVHYYFRKWSKDGTWLRLNQALNRSHRQALGREASPSVGLLDAQSVKKSEWGLSFKGFDGHKHVNGIKRQLIVDTLGLVMAVKVHPANQHDSKAAKAVIETLASQGYERMQKLLADQGYKGPLGDWLAQLWAWTLEIVVAVKGISLAFQVVPQRWKVERTISWLQWQRRLVKDYEAETDSSEAFVYLFNIRRVLTKI